MKIQVKNITPVKRLAQLPKTKSEKFISEVSEVMHDINSVRLNFEAGAEKLTSGEYLMARSYLANAELEQLYKVIAKDL